MKSAIMFADIVGSTQLYEKLGDTIAADCVNQCLKQMTEIAGQYHGTVINTIGDAILCRFLHPTDAVQAAIAIQEIFNSRIVNDHNVRISLRIGIHYGEIISREADVFGDVVNTAARVASIANARQILTTEETVSQLRPDIAKKTRRFDQINLKGKQQQSILYEIIGEDRDITMMRGIVSDHQQIQSLHINYQGVKKIIRHDSPPFVLGRSPESDLVVEADLVSRVHAYCTYRRGKFILIDQSTNGTFVQAIDNREVYLRREETPLLGKGLIGLGESTAQDNGQVIEYNCI